MSFETLHFIRPLWLLALPLAVLLPWAWRRARRPAGDWARVCDPHLLRWLAVDQSGDKPRRGGPWLAGAALAAGCAGTPATNSPTVVMSSRGGEAQLGEAILELSPDVLKEFEEWQDQR